MSEAESLLGVLKSGVHKIRGFSEIRRGVVRVSKEASMGNLSYSRADAEAGSTIFRVFNQREADAPCFFVFPFSASSSEYYLFLAKLQQLGFDLYAVASKPHPGEIISPIHSNITQLRQIIRGETPNPKGRSALINKIPPLRVLREGRFHLRFYSHQNQTVVSAHIDPPRSEHLDARQHLKGKITGDYLAGEQLFHQTLDFLKAPA